MELDKAKITISKKWLMVYAMMMVFIVAAGMFFFTDSTDQKTRKIWHDDAVKDRKELKMKLDSILFEVRKRPIEGRFDMDSSDDDIFIRRRLLNQKQ